VSPQNVVVTYDGAIKLLDFGIAKAAKRNTATEAGVIKGKFAYMSPEQALGRPLDRRSDVFSAGILLYELSTQTRLFMRESELATLKAITEEPIVSPRVGAPDYPEELERICLRALARKREDRYATAAEMQRDLARFVHRSTSDALPEHELGALMKSLFDERVAEKSQLRRILHAGSRVTQWPPAESDVTVELPLAPLRAVPAPDPLAGLNPREREVLDLLAAGRRTREIADALTVTVHTVKFHVANVPRKLDVATRGEAAAVARQAATASAPTMIGR